MQTLIKLLFIIVLPTSLFGQIGFYRQYSSHGTDYGEGLVQLEDSSYVLCGSSSSFSNHSQAFLMKLDSLGNYVWSNNYGGFEQESARRVLYKKNFGFFIAGFTNSMGAGSYDYYLAKTDEGGNLEWERTFGGSGWDRIRDAKMTRDTGTVLVGELYTPNGNSDWYVVKTDKNGDTLWTKKFGREGKDIANCVEIYQDSLIVIGGTIVNQDSLLRKAMLVYIHDDGTVIDSIEVGANGNYELNDITIINDTIRGVGNYKLLDSNTYSVAYYHIIPTPTDLQLFAAGHDNQTGDFYGQLIGSYNNGQGRYIAMGMENEAVVTGPGQDLFLAYYGQSWIGNACYMTGAYDDKGGEIISTNDGSAAMVGWRGGFGPGEGTIYLLKIGPEDVFPSTSGSTIITEIVSIEESNEIEGLKVFPNPATNNLTLEIEQQGNYTVSISDILGQFVYEENISGTSTIDVSPFDSGSYFLHLSTLEGENSTLRISIVR